MIIFIKIVVLVLLSNFCYLESFKDFKFKIVPINRSSKLLNKLSLSKVTTRSNEFSKEEDNPRIPLYDKRNIKDFVDWADSIRRLDKTRVLNISPSTLSTYRGIGINEAKKTLYSISSITNAPIYRNNDGEVSFTFSDNHIKNLKSFVKRESFNNLSNSVFNFTYNILRYSCGIFLIFSFIIYSISLPFLFAARQEKSKRDNENNKNEDERRSRHIHIHNHYNSFSPSYFNFYIHLDDFLIYFSNRSNFRPSPSFIHSIYYFLFGDYYNDEVLESDRLKQLIEVIRMNRGIVIAEELYPYLETPNNYEDEMACILPILGRLNGKVEYHNNTLIYKFDEFRLKNSTVRNYNSLISSRPLESPLQTFNSLSFSTNLKIFLLILLNFVFLHIFSYASKTTNLGDSKLLLHISKFHKIPLFFSYVYLLLPIIRLLSIYLKNKKIIANNFSRILRYNLIKEVIVKEGPLDSKSIEGSLSFLGEDEIDRIKKKIDTKENYFKSLID